MNGSMDHTAAEYFDRRAGHYDENAWRGLPRRTEMIQQLVDRLPPTSDEILELGCGTGALTAALVRRYPAARITATDASSEMLSRARERVRAMRGAQPRFLQVDFEDQPLVDASLDLITSCMALHHCADKRPLYTRLRGALRRGGYLIFADELTSALDHVETLHWNSWLEFAQQPGHLTPNELADCLAHVAEHDHYETLLDQLTLLRDAGFSRVDCAWRYLNYGVFAAKLPTTRPSTDVSLGLRVG